MTFMKSVLLQKMSCIYTHIYVCICICSPSKTFASLEFLAYRASECMISDQDVGMTTDEVTSFLREGGLEDFARVLQDEGVNSVDRLALLCDDDLCHLGLKVGHRRQLQKLFDCRYVHAAAEFSRLYGWVPYSVPPFNLLSWAQPSASWSDYSAVGCGHALSASSGPPGVFKVQHLASSQPMKVFSSSLEAFVDVGVVLNIGVVRLLQDVDIEVPEEALIFSDHGFIGRACGDAVRAAVKVRLDFEAEIRNLFVNEHKQLIAKLRERATRQAQEHMNHAAECIRSMKKSGDGVPSAEESEQVAAILVDCFYTEERLGDDVVGRNLDASYTSFRKYLEDPSDLAGLGEALVWMPRDSQFNKTVHALRTVAMLAAVRRAGGHSDRRRFEQEVNRIFPFSLQDRVPDDNLLKNLRSSVFLCFKKLFGDVPGAFQSNAQLNRAPLRPRRQRKSKPANEGEPEPEDEGKTGCGDDIMVSSLVSSRSHLDMPPTCVKNTFIEFDGPLPVGKRKVCPSEPPRPRGDTSSEGDVGDLGAVLDVGGTVEARHLLVLSELNFTLVWRDYHCCCRKEGAIMYPTGDCQLYIRPGADSFVEQLLQVPRCHLMLISCSGWHHSHNMARLFLEHAVPGVWKESKKGHLPLYVGPQEQRVYLVYGELGSGIPIDFQDKEKKRFVKDLERVFAVLLASGCGAFDVDNTVVLDSSKGNNAQTGNLLMVPTWTANDEPEDGDIFKEVLEYLMQLSKSTLSVPQHLHFHPCNVCGQMRSLVENEADGEAELMRRSWQDEHTWTGPNGEKWIKCRAFDGPNEESIVGTECGAWDTGCPEQNYKDYEKLVPNTEVWGKYGNSWHECVVLQLREDGSVRVRWHYDGSETKLFSHQIHYK